MTRFANPLAVGLSAVFLGTLFSATAELASTQVGGLKIQVAGIYQTGDSSNPDCFLNLKFSGVKADQAYAMSKVKITQAVDDTGKDLLRTNRHTARGYFWPPSKNSFGFWGSAGGISAPAADAKTIRRLKAEVDLFAPTAETPVWTNFMARTGEPFSNAMLKACQVAIRYENPASDNPPGSLVIDSNVTQSITLKISDPQNRIVNLVFQEPDGQVLPVLRHSETMMMTGASQTILSRTYVLNRPPPPDLNLIVLVSKPEPSDRITFTLENIRLPWVDLPEFSATAEGGHLFHIKDKETNACEGSLTLSFAGGQLTNALGIRRIWINQIEDSAGDPVKVNLMNNGFSSLPKTAFGDGRFVRKWVFLTFNSPAPEAIRLLKGEVELVSPAPANDYAVTITNFMDLAGKPFDRPLLEANHVRLAFLGTVNYAAVRQDFVKTNYTHESGMTLPNESPSTNANALLFSLDDPDGAVIAPWGESELNFMDAKDQRLWTTRVIRSGKFLVCRFKKLPSPETQLRVFLAVPESLRRVPFQIENIPLN